MLIFISIYSTRWVSGTGFYLRGLSIHFPQSWINHSTPWSHNYWFKVRVRMAFFPFLSGNKLRKTLMKCKPSHTKLFLTSAGLSKPIFQESTGCWRGLWFFACCESLRTTNIPKETVAKIVNNFTQLFCHDDKNPWEDWIGNVLGIKPQIAICVGIKISMVSNTSYRVNLD